MLAVRCCCLVCPVQPTVNSARHSPTNENVSMNRNAIKVNRNIVANVLKNFIFTLKNARLHFLRRLERICLNMVCCEYCVVVVCILCELILIRLSVCAQYHMFIDGQSLNETKIIIQCFVLK